MKYTKEIGKRFSGDKERAMQLQGIARVLVQQVVNRIKAPPLNGRGVLVDRLMLPDGSTVFAYVNMLGLHPIIRTWVDSRVMIPNIKNKEEEEILKSLSGLLFLPTRSEANPNSVPSFYLFGEPYTDSGTEINPPLGTQYLGRGPAYIYSTWHLIDENNYNSWFVSSDNPTEPEKGIITNYGRANWIRLNEEGELSIIDNPYIISWLGPNSRCIMGSPNHHNSLGSTVYHKLGKVIDFSTLSDATTYLYKVLGAAISSDNSKINIMLYYRRLISGSYTHHMGYTELPISLVVDPDGVSRFRVVNPPIKYSQIPQPFAAFNLKTGAPTLGDIQSESYRCSCTYFNNSGTKAVTTFYRTKLGFIHFDRSSGFSVETEEGLPDGTLHTTISISTTTPGSNPWYSWDNNDQEWKPGYFGIYWKKYENVSAAKTVTTTVENTQPITRKIYADYVGDELVYLSTTTSSYHSTATENYSFTGTYNSKDNIEDYTCTTNGFSTRTIGSFSITSSNGMINLSSPGSIRTTSGDSTENVFSASVGTAVPIRVALESGGQSYTGSVSISGMDIAKINHVDLRFNICSYLVNNYSSGEIQNKIYTPSNSFTNKLNDLSNSSSNSGVDNNYQPIIFDQTETGQENYTNYIGTPYNYSSPNSENVEIFSFGGFTAYTLTPIYIEFSGYSYNYSVLGEINNVVTDLFERSTDFYTMKHLGIV